MSYTIEFDAAHKRIAIVVAPPISEYDALKCFREEIGRASCRERV